MNKSKKVIGEQCYNCENIGTTHEHIIPQFLLEKDEQGITIPCCNICQEKLNFLDNYAADFFRIFNVYGTNDAYETAFKLFAFNNGSASSLRFFADVNNTDDIEIKGDIVVDEDILMIFIQKICICISYHLFGKLDDTYKLNIFTNFSRLGGYSPYNKGKSLTEDETQKNITFQKDMYARLKKTSIDVHGKIHSQTQNVKIEYIPQLVNNSYYFCVTIYGEFGILCETTNNVQNMKELPRNMLVAVLPIKIDINELEERRRRKKTAERGTRLSKLLLPFPSDEELRIYVLSKNPNLTELQIASFISFFKKFKLEKLWEKRAADILKEESLSGRLFLKTE